MTTDCPEVAAVVVFMKSSAGQETLSPDDGYERCRSVLPDDGTHVGKPFTAHAFHRPGHTQHWVNRSG
jgi:hypothetical protein